MTKNQIDDYKAKAQADGVPLAGFRLMSVRNRAISRQPETVEIYALSSAEKAEPMSEQEARQLREGTKAEAQLYAAMTHFRNLCSTQDPFAFVSKYAFAEKLLTAHSPPELVLRFLTDRSFYFEQYRGPGNLPGSEKYPPVPSISEFAKSDTLWRIYQAGSAELLLQGKSQAEKQKSAWEKCCGKADDQLETEDCRVYLRWCDFIIETYQQMADPPPHTVISQAMISKVFLEKCQKETLPPPNAKVLQTLLDGYQYSVNQYQIVQTVLENEWLPTNIHATFYKETGENYARLLQEIQRREDDMRNRDHLLAELNELAKRAAIISDRSAGTFPVLPKSIRRKLPQIMDIFETYARSQLHVARRKEFMPILSHQNCPNRNYEQPAVWEKPYTSSICRLLESCWMENGWHILTPLFLYHAFARNSQVIMGNSKPKLVKKITIPNQAASVQNMATETGYRAGVNLVLYQKLRSAFSGSDPYCLLQRSVETCTNTAAIQPIRDRIVPRQCVWKTRCEQDWCPFGRSGASLNDFGFYLTTGYSALFHHCGGDDTRKIPYDEIYREKKDPPEMEDPEKAENCFALDPFPEDTPLYTVYRYVYDLKKPVGRLEGLLEHHIRNCIPNRPRDLTRTTPNSYHADILHPPYEELANLLLQDMHLPAMQRISRSIKRILSEHPEYLEQFRLYMRYPWASGRASHMLNEIITHHRLKGLVPRYADYSLSTRSYHIDDSLHAILEYELRAQLIEAMQDKLRYLAYRCINRELFAYPPREKAGRRPRSQAARPSSGSS